MRSRAFQRREPSALHADMSPPPPPLPPPLPPSARPCTTWRCSGAACRDAKFFPRRRKKAIADATPAPARPWPVRTNPLSLDCLPPTHAESGRFDDAVKTPGAAIRRSLRSEADVEWPACGSALTSRRSPFPVLCGKLVPSLFGHAGRACLFS